VGGGTGERGREGGREGGGRKGAERENDVKCVF
jgi:hypothetical protein